MIQLCIVFNSSQQSNNLILIEEQSTFQQAKPSCMNNRTNNSVHTDSNQKTGKIQLKIPQALTNYTSVLQSITRDSKNLWQIQSKFFYQVELSLPLSLSTNAELEGNCALIDTIVHYLYSIGILKHQVNNKSEGPTKKDKQQLKYGIKNMTLILTGNSNQLAMQDDIFDACYKKRQSNFFKSQQNSQEKLQYQIDRKFLLNASSEQQQAVNQQNKIFCQKRKTEDQLKFLKQAMKRANNGGIAQVVLTFIQIPSKKSHQESSDKKFVQSRVICVKNVPKMTVIPSDSEQLKNFKIFIDQGCSTPLQKLSIAVKSKKFYCKRNIQTKINQKNQCTLETVVQLKKNKSDQTPQIKKFNNRSVSGPIKINSAVLQKLRNQFQTPIKQQDHYNFNQQKQDIQYDKRQQNSKKSHDNLQNLTQNIFRISKRKDIGIHKNHDAFPNKAIPVKSGQGRKIFMNNLISQQISNSQKSREQRTKQILNIYSKKNIKSRQISDNDLNRSKKRLKSEIVTEQDLIKTQQFDRKDVYLNPEFVRNTSSIFKVKKKANLHSDKQPQTKVAKVTIANLFQIYESRKKKRDRLDKLIEDI